MWLPDNMSLNQLVKQAYPNCAPCIVTLNDVEFTIYSKNGRFHREDGPAIACHEYEIWAYEGEYHCDTGPAYYWLGDPLHHRWWFHGINCSDTVEAWLDAYKLLPKDPQSWTVQHKVYFKLTFGGSFLGNQKLL